MIVESERVGTRSKAVSFGRLERQRQAQFRLTLALPPNPEGGRHDHLLAPGQEDQNLYPTLRSKDRAVRFFEERNIRWWQSRSSGDGSNGKRPTCNMASSQVACVNFLMPLIEVPDGLTATLRAIDNDVTDVVEVDHQGSRSPVEFEWIGLGHALEGPTVRTRGANCTSIDAFIVAHTSAGRRAYLMEWKYTEQYRSRDLGAGKQGETRRRRYVSLYAESDSFHGSIPFDAWLFEPFYQIMRLRLLADRMIRDGEFGVSQAKVVVVVPEGNKAYQERITSPWFAKAFPNRTVSDIVREALTHPDDAYTSISQSTLANAVRDSCGEATATWGSYQRDRYGW